MNLSIGHKIKELRLQKNMTLKDVSESSGLSAAHLSQLERGITSTSVNTLNQIALALGTDIHYFIGTPKGSGCPVHRRHEQKAIVIEQGSFTHYSLSNMEDTSELIPRYVELLPTLGEEETSTFPHEGEEIVYVIHGILTLLLDGEEHQLFPGDCAHYSSMLPHQWINRTNSLVEVLTVNDTNFFAKTTIP